MKDSAPYNTQHSANAGTDTTSKSLLGNKKQLIIEHNGEYYTLRVTANNKLILTK